MRELSAAINMTLDGFCDHTDMLSSGAGMMRRHCSMAFLCLGVTAISFLRVVDFTNKGSMDMHTRFGILFRWYVSKRELHFIGRWRWCSSGVEWIVSLILLSEVFALPRKSRLLTYICLNGAVALRSYEMASCGSYGTEEMTYPHFVHGVEFFE